MKRFVFLLGLSLSALLAPLHAALPGSDALAGLILGEFDKDSDSQVARTEWDRGINDSFSTLDHNNDESIASNEVDVLKADIAEQTGELTAGVVLAIIKQAVLSLDADKDKLVSRKEYETLARGIFDKLDTDKNGSLTRAELSELPTKLIAP